MSLGSSRWFSLRPSLDGLSSIPLEPHGGKRKQNSQKFSYGHRQAMTHTYEHTRAQRINKQTLKSIFKLFLLFRGVYRPKSKVRTKPNCTVIIPPQSFQRDPVLANEALSLLGRQETTQMTSPPPVSISSPVELEGSHLAH